MMGELDGSYIVISHLSRVLLELHQCINQMNLYCALTSQSAIVGLANLSKRILVDLSKLALYKLLGYNVVTEKFCKGARLKVKL